MYRLTPEGQRYLDHGLPERRLLAALPAPMASLQGLEDFSIGLQWAKKNGWIAIDKGHVQVLVQPPERLPIEEALHAAAIGSRIDATIAFQLVQRRLIEEVRDDLVAKAQKQLDAGSQVLTPELLSTGMWKHLSFKPYDVSIAPVMYGGKRHPYAAFLRRVRQQLLGMGFREMTGPLIELEFWNFDALFQPQNHPSRDWTQTYALKNAPHGTLPDQSLVERVKKSHEQSWGYQWDERKASKLMPRAHDTAISPRYLSSAPMIPGKYFSLVRCFRPDVIDATHGVEFNQLGGFVIDENLSFRHLLGLLKEFVREITGYDQVRFKPDYFPFTEPSCEVAVKGPKGWMELAGAGIFREELTRPLGITQPVIAWGFGIDRLAMLSLGINDIRELFSRNLQWLREQETR